MTDRPDPTIFNFPPYFIRLAIFVVVIRLYQKVVTTWAGIKNLIYLGAKDSVAPQFIFFIEIWKRQAEIELDPKYTCIFITFSCETENMRLIPPS